MIEKSLTIVAKPNKNPRVMYPQSKVQGADQEQKHRIEMTREN
jgi:hypothetical protein